MLKELIKIFEKVGVCYEQVSEKEIAIPCPCDILPYGSNLIRPQIEIIEDKQMTCLTDEAWVLIQEDENGELSWLVVAHFEN